ncbi:YqeB family protein [Streptomyces echinatus]|uniref:YqeB family protein n=1 Tax=Streptomyces echinatus TaxID=67293 RepID=UPI0038088A4E
MASKQPHEDLSTHEDLGASVPDVSATVLGHPRSDRIVLLAGMPLSGTALGLLVPILARQVTHWPKLPFRIVFEFLAAAEETWQVLACMGCGFGLVFALVALSESLTVTLTDARVEARTDHWREGVDRGDVSAVFMDGKHLVVLDRDSRQRVRGPHAAPGRSIAAAFRGHGYPWNGSDPYAHLYRKWAHGSGAVRPEVDAVLAARGEALKRKSWYDVHRLTQAVEELGCTAREKGTEQYWRPLVRS